MMGQTDRQTDARQFHRPCFAYYAGSANNPTVTAIADDVVITVTLLIHRTMTMTLRLFRATLSAFLH